MTNQSISDDNLMHVVETKYVNSKGKRVFDILLSVLLFPIVVLILSSVIVVYPFFGGFDIFYKHRRVGRNGRVFYLYKIRSMVRNHNNPRAGLDKNDGTIIPGLGNFLRQSRIDELPQIWNIFRGEMSWVGPRPEQVDFVELYKSQNHNYNKRHLIRPGITGLAQIVNPNASMDDYAEKLISDIEYVNTSSLLLDIKILAKSVLIIVR